LNEAEKNKAAPPPPGTDAIFNSCADSGCMRPSLSSEMAGELSRLTCEGENLHTGFRKDGDWSKIKDWYAHAVDLMRSVGEIKKNRLGMFVGLRSADGHIQPWLEGTKWFVAEFAEIEKSPARYDQRSDCAADSGNPKRLDLPKND